jgi:putative PEP-CTERM system histidine kinase
MDPATATTHADAGPSDTAATTPTPPESQLPAAVDSSFPLKSFQAAVRKNPEPVDLDKATDDWATALRLLNPGLFRKGGNRISLPIVANDQVLGVMILADRVSGIPFSFEERDLLRCIGSHVAASLLGLQLSHKLLHAKEQEAFRAVSTFFAHDLKNAASSLSLMLQNLPKHFEDPEFRADVLRGLGRTVSHMNHLISRLSVFRESPVIKPVAADLSDVVSGALTRWQAIPGIEVCQRLETLPKALLDREQIQNVVTNLLLNARDALGPSGEIRVETARQNGWAVLTVSDNGCGMPPEFVRNSLFRPFKTTKKDGTGIGMFQCKMIVEAHRGRIEVESEPGKGTSFRVLLPLQTAS